jgi:hypothetical protein
MTTSQEVVINDDLRNIRMFYELLHELCSDISCSSGDEYFHGVLWLFT